jgi:outer membrane receptor protein involved in Fe transport
MREGAADELGDVGILEGVVDVLAVAPANHEPFGPEQLEPLRHRGHAIAGLLREFGNAALPMGKPLKEPEPRGVSHGPKERRGTLHGVVVRKVRPRAAVPVVVVGYVEVIVGIGRHGAEGFGKSGGIGQDSIHQGDRDRGFVSMSRWFSFAWIFPCLAAAWLGVPSNARGQRSEPEFSATGQATEIVDEGREARSRVTRTDIEERMPRSAPDALKYEPGVSIQQTAHGQASPFIRGLTGQQVLLTFDGIRLNNGLYRQGPNQYFFTVDLQTLDHIDVIRGSASTVYGSDAIGGAILAAPIDVLSKLDPEGATLKPRLTGRFGSPDLERGGRAEVLLSPDSKTGVRIGVGYRVADRLESGGVVRNPGERTPLVPRFEADGRTQLGTGFQEGVFDVRLEHEVEPGLRVVGAVYGFRQSDVPRTDQCPPPEARIEDCLTFDHQDRTLAYVALRGDVAESIRDLDVSFAWQGQFEDKRLEIPGAFVRTDSINRVSTLSASMRASSPALALGGGHHLRVRYGAEIYRDAVGSTESKTFTDIDRTRVASRGQYMDGSTFLQTAAFLDGSLALAERLTLSSGARFAFVAARAPGDPDSDTTAVAEDRGALIAHAGASYRARDEWTLSLNYDQGFRAANLDDLTSRQQVGPGFQFENPNLRPERSHTFELGSALDVAWLSLDAWGFVTLLDDAISRAVREATDCPASTPNCGSARDQFQLVNAPGTTVLLGTEGGATVFLPLSLTARATVAYAWGEQDNTGSRPAAGESFYGARVPVSRVPPLQGTVELRWRHQPSGFFVAGASRWALAQNRLAPSDLSDPRIPFGGTPAYAVFDLRAGWRYRELTRFGVTVENLLDTPYRVHGSSLNGPGFGVLLTASIGL